MCVAFADCHYHTLLQDSALLFVYALHFFLLTQPALGPPAHSSCVVPATASPLHGTGLAQRAWLLEQGRARPGISIASSQHRSAIPICAAPTARAPLGSAPQPGGDHGIGCPHWPCLHIGGAMKKKIISGICNAKAALLMGNHTLYSAQVYMSELCKSVMENILPLILGSVKP